MYDAARRASIHETIMNFPEKYATVVGERGLKVWDINLFHGIRAHTVMIFFCPCQWKRKIRRENRGLYTISKSFQIWMIRFTLYTFPRTWSCRSRSLLQCIMSFTSSYFVQYCSPLLNFLCFLYVCFQEFQLVDGVYVYLHYLSVTVIIWHLRILCFFHS